MSLRNRLQKAEQQIPAPPEPRRRIVRTTRDQPCILHTEPGPETFTSEHGTEVLVTEEIRAAWKRDGVGTICRIFVGTCHSNGCDPSLPGAERWLR